MFKLYSFPLHLLLPFMLNFYVIFKCWKFSHSREFPSILKTHVMLTIKPWIMAIRANSSITNSNIESCPGFSEYYDSVHMEVFTEPIFWSLEDISLPEENISSELQVKLGGLWGPCSCAPTYSSHIIVPLRNRMSHLRKFLLYMHKFLQLQNIQYRIIVVEQMDDQPFNKGKLMNIGFVESLKIDPVNRCFIFHDVSLLPESGQNMYTCASSPRLMSTSINYHRYSRWPDDWSDKVIAIEKTDFELANGFPNTNYDESVFWESPLFNRICKFKKFILQTPFSVGSYRMLPYKENQRRLLRKKATNSDEDGLNSLKYQVVNHVNTLLYTLIQIST